MLLPTKGISARQSLIAVGGEILTLLATPAAPSELLERIKNHRTSNEDATPIPYDWFSLALALLYSIDAIHLDSGGKVRKTRVSS